MLLHIGIHTANFEKVNRVLQVERATYESLHWCD